jgi:hypothetical protein
MNHNARWKKHYSALVQYQQRYGDAAVPSGHIEFLDSGEEINLGNWVSYMRTRYRQNALSDDRVRLLASIPTWDWGPLRPGPQSHALVVLRNNKIRVAYSKGSSLSEIAKAYGLSRQRIHQIVKEKNEQR